MINIINDLSSLNIPVYVEGDAPESLPNEYYTVSEDYTSGNVFADNEQKSILYEFTLKYYTTNAETLYTGVINALQVLKSLGYITTGNGYANSTYQNKWFSRMADVQKIENLN